MSYCQLNADGTFLREVFGGLQVWDANNYCSVDALVRDGKADQFHVVPLTVIAAPTIDPITQSVARDGCEKVNDQWQYKWLVTNLSAEQIAANQAAAAQALQDSIVKATQARLDAFAHTRNYDGILSACTYVTSSVPKFAAEGQAAVDGRDATWATLYTLLAEVLAETRPMPDSFADVEPLLPALEWPA